MKSRIALWTTLGIAIYIGASLYQGHLVKKYQEPGDSTSSPALSAEQAQKDRLRDATTRARVQLARERARRQLAAEQPWKDRLGDAKTRARVQLARERARQQLAALKEKKASPVIPAIAQKSQNILPSETGRKKIKALKEQLSKTQKALQEQTVNNRARITILEKRIVRANELITLQRKELGEVGTERENLLVQTGENDINLSALQNKIRYLEQGRAQKNLELRKSLSDLAVTKKKLEKSLMVEKKAKGLELLLDGLKEDLASTQSKLTAANGRIVALSAADVKKAASLKQVELNLGATRDTLSKLEDAHRQTTRLAQGYKSELDRLNAVEQNGFLRSSSLEEQLDSATTRIALLEMELERAKLKANAMLEFGQENERLVTPSKQQISALKNLLHNKQQDLDQALGRIDSLKKKQNSLTLLVKEKEVSLAAKDGEISAIQSAKDGLAAELTDLQNRLSNALDTTTKVNDLLKQALQSKKETTEKVVTLNRRVRELEQNLSDQEAGQEMAVTQAAEQTTARAGAQIATLTGVVAEHESTIGRLNTELEAALQKNASTGALLSSNSGELGKLQAQLVDRERERDTLSSKVARLQGELKQATRIDTSPKATHSAVAALEQKVSAQQQALANKNQQINSLQGEVSGLEVQREKLLRTEEQVAALQESVREKIGQLDEANRLSKELSAQLAEADKERASFGTKLGALGELLAEVQATKKGFSQRAMDAEKELGTLKETVRSLERERDVLLLELESRQAKIEALLTSLDTNRISSEQSQEGALLIKNGTDQQVEALKSLLRAKERALQRLTSLTGFLVNSKSELTTMMNEVEQLKSLLKAKEVAFHQLAVRVGSMSPSSPPMVPTAGELLEIKVLLAAKSAAFQKLAVTTAALAGREKNIHLELEQLQTQYTTLLGEITDSDNDSVADNRDACPQTIAGALVDEKGCAGDFDLDGVVNGLDLCPHSSFVEVNVLGCAVDENILLTGVTFTPGKSILTPGATKWLAPMVAILNQHGEFSFEVAGHTDSVGDHEKNLRISRERALSVRNYFTAHGLKEERFTVKGYGPDQPVADNSVREGRMANRRVELYFNRPVLPME